MNIGLNNLLTTADKEENIMSENGIFYPIEMGDIIERTKIAKKIQIYDNYNDTNDKQTHSLKISMINHGLSLTKNTNKYLNDEFVNIKCKNNSNG